jgi:hypothetical protein
MGSSDRNGAKSKQGKSPVESYEESLSTGLNQKKILFLQAGRKLMAEAFDRPVSKTQKTQFLIYF